MRIFITSFLLLYSLCAYSYTREEVIDYIELYKLIAVEEMQKCGIPASIKMAQAILESNAGTSDLALEANNHFGIKCGGVWEGPTFFKEDDDRDRKGRLIKSCFRVFQDGEDSFRAHSKFLMDPKKEYRYGSLFDIDRTDYKSWAWGLSKAGYATNPAYANLLIHLIEKYSLYTFDYYENSNVRFIKPSDLIAESRDVEFMEKLEKKSKHAIVSKPGEQEMRPSRERQIEVNDRAAVKVLQGQTMEQLAQKYDLTSKEILRYNENEMGLDDFLEEGTYVYLEKKRIWYKGSEKFHIVREGEDLHRISQMYGVRLATLERKNKIDADMIPLPGEKIILRGKAARGDKIPLTYSDVEIVESSEVKQPILADRWENLRKAEREKEIVEPKGGEDHQEQQPVLDLSQEEVKLDEIPDEKVEIVQTAVQPVEEKPLSRTAQTAKIYEVVKGDTLFGISRKFDVSIDSIRHHNQLLSDQISIGQKIKIVK